MSLNQILPIDVHEYIVIVRQTTKSLSRRHVHCNQPHLFWANAFFLLLLLRTWHNSRMNHFQRHLVMTYRGAPIRTYHLHGVLCYSRYRLENTWPCHWSKLFTNTEKRYSRMTYSSNLREKNNIIILTTACKKEIGPQLAISRCQEQTCQCVTLYIILG